MIGVYGCNIALADLEKGIEKLIEKYSKNWSNSREFQFSLVALDNVHDDDDDKGSAVS